MSAVGWPSLSVILVCLLVSGQAGRRAGSRCHPFPPLQESPEPPPLVITGRLLAFYPVHVPNVRFPVRRRGLVPSQPVIAGHVTRPQLVVEGFYQLGVCNSRLRLRDSRIFFLKAPGQRQLQSQYRSDNDTTIETDFLLISTARMTQRNMKIARAYSGQSCISVAGEMEGYCVCFIHLHFGFGVQF